MILLSGDQHWAGAFATALAADCTLLEFSPTPLGVGSRAKPASNAPQILFKYDDSRVYGFFSVDTTVQPATLSFDIYSDGNTSLYRLDTTDAAISQTCSTQTVYLPFVSR